MFVIHSLSSSYTGIEKVNMNDERCALMYADKTKNVFDLLENQYLLIVDDDNNVVDRFKWQDGKHKPIWRKPVESSALGKIKAKNPEQECAIDLLLDDSTTVKCLSGSFGSGKAQPNSTMIPTPDGCKRLGDLVAGDYVYNRHGVPVKILSVYPQGFLDNYKVILSDGRYTYCNNQHLWSYVTSKDNIKTITLAEMIKTGIKTKDNVCRYRLPMVSPVIYSEKIFPVDPYVIGVFIGNGCTLEKALTLSSADEEVVQSVCDLLGASSYVKSCPNNYSWVFKDSNGKRLQTKEVLPVECIGHSGEKSIPENYMLGSVSQRMALLQGLLDTDGSVDNHKGRVSYSTTSTALANQIRRLIWSLGFNASISEDGRKEKYKSGHCYQICISCPAAEKVNLFRIARKRERVNAVCISKYSRDGYARIVDVQKMPEQEEMTCIFVDDPEHIYLTESYIPTHNTMLTSACAFKLIQDGKFDRILWVRNNIEVKDSNPIGHLKGDYYDKMSVWAMPLADHVGGKDQLDLMIQHGTVEVVHLGFLRGRDIKNSIIFCSEAEHLTRSHVQLLLGRVAEGSIIIFEGDFRQIDAKAFERDNGLEAAINCLKGNRLFSYVHMHESVRSETAKLADLLEVNNA